MARPRSGTSRPRRVPLVLEQSHAGTRAVAWSPDGATLVTGGPGKPTRLWHARSGELLATLAASDAIAASFDRSRSRLVTLHGGPAAHIWDSGRGVLEARIEPSASPLVWARFLPDGRLITLDQSHGVHIHDLASGERTAERTVNFLEDENLPNSQARPWGPGLTAALGDDGSTLALYGPARQSIALWRAPRLAPITRLEGHDKGARFLVMSRDGALALSVSNRDTIRLWNARSGQALHELSHSSQVSAARFGPRGRIAITGTTDGSAIVWRVDTGEMLGRLEGHEGYVSCIDISANGALVLTGSGDKTVKVWDLERFRLLDSLAVESSAVRRCELHSTGQEALVLSADQVLIWTVDRDRRGPAEVNELARCRSGFRLEAGRPERLSEQPCY